MVPRSTDLPVAVAVRRLRCGGMAAAAPAATWRVRDMPATPTPVNALKFVMIWAPSFRKKKSHSCVILRLSVSAQTHN